MPLRDRDYNAFAFSLSRRFRDRILGLDAGRARVINSRPSDHVLAGFLTPAPQNEPEAVPGADTPDADERLADDLPKDSAYEQTAIGLEWLAPIDSLANTAVSVEIGAAVYVRRIPSLEEQRARVVWKDSRTFLQRRSGAAAERLADLIVVWTRETLAPIRRVVNLQELVQQRKLAIDLADDIRNAVGRIDMSDLYTGRRPIHVTPADLESVESYERAVSATSPVLPIDWKAEIDIRLIETPTEEQSVGIALRLINRTDPVSVVSSDYVDPNLYAVRIGLSFPRAAYRYTTFRELPASFRYNRQMVATGINSHVTLDTHDETATLHVDTVPIATVPRLEPRVIPDAQPTFATLAQAPISLLRSLHAAMANYDRSAWESRIGVLEGTEHAEATQARNIYRLEMERFARGIDLLDNPSYPAVRRAFELMNRSMLISAAPHQTWRLFQIVFIVSQLPILAAREYPELARDDDGFVDVLWFAAGGGKTEAFLGLIVWQAFFDRMRGKNVGVTAFAQTAN